jgi:adenylate cyclase
MADIFLSYARQDADTARRFADAFEASGFSVWWDAALRTGDTFDEAIERALREARAVVVLWSPSSVASRWVRAEATLADRNRTLLPVTIAPCQRPIIFELTHSAELAHWRGNRDDAAWLALAADARRLVDAQAAPRGAQAAAAVTARVAVPGRPGVVILPFVNMSGDPEQEYFADGVTEDIITDLARVSGLAVASRNAAFSYKGKAVAPAQLARSLGVTHVMEGSVRKSGNRVRITAQLLDAATDAPLWAERFDRTLDDIFAIQDEISKAIVAALKVRLLPSERQALEQRPTHNSEAYELFLIARGFQRKGSERLKPVIIRICRRVVELDPGFAKGWALLSTAESEMGQRGIEGYSFASARASAERAIAADPGVAEGHAALAEALIRGEMDQEPAKSLLQTALRLDPNCFDALTVAGSLAIVRREHAKSIEFFERAIALEPDAYWPSGMVAQSYEALGDADATAAAHRRALACCERILADEPDHSGALGFFVSALGSLGFEERAREWTKRALLFDPDNRRLHYNLACAMASLGDAELASDLVEPLIDRVSHGYLRWMQADNSLDAIRGHPRFAAIMQRAADRLAREEAGGAGTVPAARGQKAQEESP